MRWLAYLRFRSVPMLRRITWVLLIHPLDWGLRIGIAIRPDWMPATRAILIQIGPFSGAAAKLTHVQRERLAAMSVLSRLVEHEVGRRRSAAKRRRREKRR